MICRITHNLLSHTKYMLGLGVRRHMAGFLGDVIWGVRNIIPNRKRNKCPG